MTDLEKLSEYAMEIIAYSGVAKSKYVESIRFAKKNDFTSAEKMILEADNVLKTAHDSHMQLLQRESEEKVPQVSLLVLHAEDQFMSCETIKLMALEIIDLYKKMKNI